MINFLEHNIHEEILIYIFFLAFPGNSNNTFKNTTCFYQCWGDHMAYEDILYLHDSSLKEWDAEVVSVDKDKYIVLNKTAFYPNAGGQPYDTGSITTEDGAEYKVVYVGKFSGKISHEVDKPGLKPGDKVHCKLDWERRYTLMRMHSAAHILSAIYHNEAGAIITGNQLNIDKSRMDFSLEAFDREKIQQYLDMANEIVEKDLPIQTQFITREELEKVEMKLIY